MVNICIYQPHLNLKQQATFQELFFHVFYKKASQHIHADSNLDEQIPPESNLTNYIVRIL